MPYLASGVLFYWASLHMDEELGPPRAPPDIKARHEKGGYDADAGDAVPADAEAVLAQEREPLIARVTAVGFSSTPA